MASLADGIGLDVGSTTVKAVAVREGALVFRAYRRHRGQALAEAISLLTSAQEAAAIGARVVVTGSAGPALADRLGADFVHEVHAVAAEARAMVPGVRTIIELGGQDAKMIHLDARGGLVTEMNERCAAGTGVVIDRCAYRLGVEALDALVLGDAPLPVVSARCGVFAETDLVALVKAGQPAEVAMRALLDAIVRQNLVSLAHGRPLPGPVCLLGGPNAFIPALREAWRRHLEATWRERGVEPTPLIVPPDAALFAARGALRALGDADRVAAARGRRARLSRVHLARVEPLPSPPVVRVERVAPPAPSPRRGPLGLGLDAGSTTVKAVALDGEGAIVASAYRRGGANIFEDTSAVLSELGGRLGARVDDITSLGLTGYAADLLAPLLGADCALVETLAHARSARRFVPDADVVCDVGGQDIKVLMLEGSHVRDFKLSQQCAAGNGALLEATASALGVPLEQLAEVTSQAHHVPRFSVGCAVFLDTERVSAQRDGMGAPELLAGLTAALPRTIWESVVATPSLSALGEVFVLSGGVQRNAAAVRAQAEYILARHARARVVLHPFPGEAGAIGAALAGRASVRGASTFIGLAAATALRCAASSDESTRCRRCPSHCARTLLVAERGGERRTLVTGNGCERGGELSGTALSTRSVLPERSRGGSVLLGIRTTPRTASTPLAGLIEPTNWPTPVSPSGVDGALRSANSDSSRKASTPLGQNGARLPVSVNPLGQNGASVPVSRAKNLLRVEATRIFRRAHAVKVVSTLGSELRIAIPRVLSLYRAAPLLTHYFEALGVPPQQLVTGEFTSEALWRRHAGRGTTDACYPAKVAQAHVAQLLAHREAAPFDVLFFPVLTHAVTGVKGCADTAACPVVAGTPLVTRIAFGADAEGRLPGGVRLLTPTIVLSRRKELSAGLYESVRTLLPTLSREVHELALVEGIAGQRRSEHLLEQLGAAAIREGANTGRCALVLLGRPYHADPGLHHELGSELVSLGRTVMSLRALPHSPEMLASIDCASTYDLSDLSFLTNSGDGERLAGARLVGLHPFLVAIDLSSFKCGQDAALYGRVAQAARGLEGKPFLALHDLDETRPTASLRLRVRTFLDGVERWEARARRHRAEVA